MVVTAREFNKARTTFIDTILTHSYHSRIHADINQMRGETGGTVTGRFSYSNPNLQQIPARNKDIGPLIRSIFVPDEGCKWGSFDYSSARASCSCALCRAYRWRFERRRRGY
jgi:DNA polymerase I-like protein with 3'-5' exonuclease and polymerase domains